jgi:pimeloyl-ACP methyl ester carboxylesterase
MDTLSAAGRFLELPAVCMGRLALTRIPRAMRVSLALNILSALLLASGVVGCTVDPVRNSNGIARRAGFQPLELTGMGFSHTAYARLLRGDTDLVVVVEGDGLPWIGGGRVIATDPTPHRPIALQLAVRTPGSVLYLGRPCYFAARFDPSCESRWWTSQRYAVAVVASMCAAAQRFADEHQMKRMLLIGYSGGGTIAVLMAARMSRVSGVVSIAGNLDTDAWTRYHQYLALDGSLNPAREPQLPQSLPQLYLVGEHDANVPYETVSAYLQRVPPEDVWQFEAFDHSCCWVREWPSLFSRIRTALDVTRVPRVGAFLGLEEPTGESATTIDQPP